MITFSSMSGTSGITQIIISATSNSELESLVENYTLSNGTKSLLMPIAQRAYVPTGKYISFKPSSFSFESSGGTGSLQVTSNDDWYINFGSWVYPNEVRGNGNTIVGIRVEANTGDTRSGSITGYCLSDSAQTASTSVSQVGSYVRPFLSVSPLKTAVNASGGTGFTLAVTSNQDWITYADARWVTMNTLSGSGDGSISFEVVENATDIVRESNIYVVSTASSLSATSVIVQSAQTQEEPYIIVSPTTKRIGTSGGSFTVTVSSNTEWETAVVYGVQVRNWIALDKLNGYGDDTVEVRIDPDVQESISGRSAYISFYNTNENLKAEVNISQYDIPLNKVFYTTTDGNVLSEIVTGVSWGNAQIISNTYENGIGTILFDSDLETIPSGVCRNYTKLSSITIPEGVETVGIYAFQNCTALTNVYWNAINVVNGDRVFNGCSGITDIYFGDNVTTFPRELCEYLGDVNVHFSPLITEIPFGAFSGSGITDFVLPNQITTIGQYAFYNCFSLTSFTVNEGSQYVADYNFPPFGSNEYQRYMNVELVLNVSGTPFDNCVSTNVTKVRYNASSVPSNSFKDNYYEGSNSLTAVTLTDKVREVGELSFWHIQSLENIYSYSTTAPTLGSGAFLKNYPDYTIHHPIGSNYDDWKNIDYLSDCTFVADL